MLTHDVHRRQSLPGLFAIPLLLISGTLIAATTQSTDLTLTAGHTTITLPRPASLTESPQSTATQRILESKDSTTQIVALPSDQPTDPAAATAFAENTKQAMTTAKGADLIVPPTVERDARFTLLMHYRVKMSPESAVDTTIYWRRVGPATVQATTAVRSQDSAAITAITTDVTDMLARAAAEGYPAETPVVGAAAANSADPAALQAAANAESLSNLRQKFAGDTVEFSSPPNFEQIASAHGDTSRDYLSSDHVVELIVTLMPPNTALDSSSGAMQLAVAKRELTASGSPPTTAPVLLKDTALPVAIQWSFLRDGKPAQGFRLFRKIHPKQVVRCEITTTGDPKHAQQLGEATLNGMTSLLPPDQPPVAATPSKPRPVGSAAAEEKRNQRAQAALEQAKKLADAGKDDDAYSKYKYIATEYPNSPSATEAKTAMEKFEADPAFVERHKKPAEAGPTEKAAAMLALADNYSYLGRQDDARAKYQQLIKEYPDTPSAEKAKKRLADLTKAPVTKTGP